MEKIKNVELRVVGVTFRNDDGSSRRDIITNMTIESPIFIEREPDNVHDANAIKVLTDGGQIGYIGRDYSSILAGYMDAGRQFTAKLKSSGIANNRPYCSIIVDEV